MAIKFEDIRAETPKKDVRAEASKPPVIVAEQGDRPASAKTTLAEKPKRKSP